MFKWKMYAVMKSYQYNSCTTKKNINKFYTLNKIECTFNFLNVTEQWEKENVSLID